MGLIQPSLSSRLVERGGREDVPEVATRGPYGKKLRQKAI
jgi:hypothetical protein